MVSHRGRCLCGAVVFEISEDPIGTRACWCRDCQYLCSGNASLSVFIRQRALSVSGKVAEFTKLSDSGNPIRRRFCPACGTPLFADDVNEPELMIVRLGTLHNRDGGEPASTIWTDCAPSWALYDATKPNSPKQPEPGG